MGLCLGPTETLPQALDGVLETHHCVSVHAEPSAQKQTPNVSALQQGGSLACAGVGRFPITVRSYHLRPLWCWSLLLCLMAAMESRKWVSLAVFQQSLMYGHEAGQFMKFSCVMKCYFEFPSTIQKCETCY